MIRIISFINKIEVREGRVASGDIWNKEKDRIKYFNEKYSTLCEEMELYSIYKICEQEKIPCIGIKIISNNEMNGQEYDKTVADYLDDFLYKIIICHLSFTKKKCYKWLLLLRYLFLNISCLITNYFIIFLSFIFLFLFLFNIFF